MARYAGLVRADPGELEGRPVQRPGPVQNTPLVRPPGMFEPKHVYSRWGARLKPKISPGRDYVQVSEHVWSILHHWYGGGPLLCRPIIE